MFLVSCSGPIPNLTRKLGRKWFKYPEPIPWSRWCQSRPRESLQKNEAYKENMKRMKWGRSIKKGKQKQFLKKPDSNRIQSFQFLGYLKILTQTQCCLKLEIYPPVLFFFSYLFFFYSPSYSVFQPFTHGSREFGRVKVSWKYIFAFPRQLIPTSANKTYSANKEYIKINGKSLARGPAGYGRVNSPRYSQRIFSHPTPPLPPLPPPKLWHTMQSSHPLVTETILEGFYENRKLMFENKTNKQQLNSNTELDSCNS